MALPDSPRTPYDFAHAAVVGEEFVMRKPIICLLLLMFSFSGSLAAQEHDFSLGIREHIFDNGLRLLVIERPQDSRVVSKIFTDMGALHETPGQLGSAHFLEHLMFKARRPWARETGKGKRICMSK